MILSVCIGSACHLRGSYEVKNTFESMISEYNLGEKITLQVAFCLGHCKDGVTIKIDDEIVTGVTKENASDVFTEKILKKHQ